MLFRDLNGKSTPKSDFLLFEYTVSFFLKILCINKMRGHLTVTGSLF